jgi:hypothetical protein
VDDVQRALCFKQDALIVKIIVIWDVKDVNVSEECSVSIYWLEELAVCIA